MSVTGQQIIEYEALHDLVSSEGWRFVRNMLVERRRVLEDELKSALRKHEDRKAGEKLARIDETLVTIELVRNRVKELQTKKEN